MTRCSIDTLGSAKKLQASRSDGWLNEVFLFLLPSIVPLSQLQREKGLRWKMNEIVEPDQGWKKKTDCTQKRLYSNESGKWNFTPKAFQCLQGIVCCEYKKGKEMENLVRVELLTFHNSTNSIIFRVVFHVTGRDHKCCSQQKRTIEVENLLWKQRFLEDYVWYPISLWKSTYTNVVKSLWNLFFASNRAFKWKKFHTNGFNLRMKFMGKVAPLRASSEQHRGNSNFIYMVESCKECEIVTSATLFAFE